MCSTVAPYNVAIMGDNLYNQGEQLQLNCSSEGGPVYVLEYTWLLSGNTIPNINTSTLTINSVTTTDGGNYTCNVTNNAGSANNNITVYSKSLSISRHTYHILNYHLVLNLGDTKLQFGMTHTMFISLKCNPSLTFVQVRFGVAKV